MTWRGCSKTALQSWRRWEGGREGGRERRVKSRREEGRKECEKGRKCVSVIVSTMSLTSKNVVYVITFWKAHYSLPEYVILSLAAECSYNWLNFTLP